MKTVYGWVVNWGAIVQGSTPVKPPNITVDLFFTSREKWEKLLGWSKESMDKEILIPVEVPDNFDDLDYIPLDY